MGIDVVVNGFMESIQSSSLTSVSKILAPIFDPVILLVLAIIVAPYIYIKSSKKKGILFGGVMILSAAIVWAVKEIVQRARPENALLPEFS